uniref:Uncharacterized protein n=1 Tax=Sarcophilus harrisii TaxID=9305 RepID=A0A7N4NHM8_SARHA
MKRDCAKVSSSLESLVVCVCVSVRACACLGVLGELGAMCSSSLASEGDGGSASFSFGVQAPQRPVGVPPGAGTLRTLSRSSLPSRLPDMKLLVALAVLFLASAQAFAEETGANDDLNYWADWSDSDQIKRNPGASPSPSISYMHSSNIQVPEIPRIGDTLSCEWPPDPREGGGGGPEHQRAAHTTASISDVQTGCQFWPIRLGCHGSRPSSSLHLLDELRPVLPTSTCLMSIHFLSDTSVEKQVGMLKALYGHGQMSHKRHKTDSFVGLMGKRSLTSGSSEWGAAQNYERRRK